MDREVREPLDADRRDRARARHDGRAVHLAGRHGQALRRRVRPARGADARVQRRARTATATTTRSSTASTTRPTPSASATQYDAGRGRDRAAARRRAARSTATPSSPAGRRRCSSARRSTTSACAKCSTRWSTWRRRPAPRAGDPARRRARRGEVHRRRVQDPGEHGPGAPRPHRVRARRARAASSAACG